MRRVLAPGGLISVGEWDWDSTCLAVTDRELGRRFTHLLCDQMHNGLIVRELPRQLERYGFTRVTVTPQVHLSRDPGAAYEWLIEPMSPANSPAPAHLPPGKATGFWTTCASEQPPAGTSWPAPTTR